MKNADMPAMPIVDSDGLGTPMKELDLDAVRRNKVAFGMTKREMMAMHILSGLLSDYEFDVTRQMAAEIAVEQADALLAELDRTAK